MDQAAVRESFDRIALVENSQRWTHNNHYHNLILSCLPVDRHSAIDIGCGAGDMVRLLGGRFAAVTGIDFSEEMIRIARAKSAGCGNLTYLCTDALTHDYGQDSADFVVSIATFHHLPLRAMFERIRHALRGGGRLVVLDLYKAETLTDYLLTAAAVPVNLLQEGIRNRGRRRTQEEADAWKQHAVNDRLPKIREVHEAAAEMLPGAQIRRLLYWRYILVWNKGWNY